MSAFDKALDVVIQFETGGDPEGGFTEDPADPGGATRWGISQRANPEINPKTLTRKQASDIYREKYWKPTVEALGLDAPGSEALALSVFDFAVNSGPEQAIRTLQRNIGATADGIPGPKTRAALTAYLNSKAMGVASAELNSGREVFLENLAVSSPKLSRFKMGWLRRVGEVGALSAKLAEPKR